MVTAILQTATAGLVCAGLFWTWRMVSRRSPLLGMVLAASLLIRTLGGLFFFWTSFLALPFLENLQLGNGFWTLAPDAEEYFRLMSRAAADWHYQDPQGRSFGFVVTVGWWLRAVGVNPAGVVFFNLVLSVAMVAAIVVAFGRFRDRRAEWAAAVSVAAFSFSPMLIFTTVHGLKDVFVIALVIAVVIAATTFLPSVLPRSALRYSLIALTVAAASVWLLAATRIYLAILLWAAIAAAYVLGTLFAGRSLWPRFVTQGAVVLLVFGLAVLSGGSDSYYTWLAKDMLVQAAKKVVPSRAFATPGARDPRAAASPPKPLLTRGVETLDARRDGFTRTGGNTTLELAANTGARDRSRALFSGLAATFVPMSILQRLSLVTLPRQTGFLVLADADTLFLDLTIVVIGWILIRNRQHLDPELTVLLVVLAVMTTGLMAYIVTNFGTLIRLRLMIAAPIWLLPLSMAPGFRRRVPESKADAKFAETERP
jgi:hypothetical protein